MTTLYSAPTRHPDGIVQEGNYAYATGRLEGIIKNAAIELEHGTAPDIVASMLRRYLNEVITGLEGTK